MAFALDHVVIAVADLDQAIVDYRSLGFTVHPGGVHHGGLSHNALIVFADGAYFEIIAYQRPDPANPWWRLLTEDGEGFVDFALVPDDTQANLNAARARGLILQGPTDGGRLRPDGVRLDWQIVRPETRDLPFWCGDVTPRHLRVPEGAHRQHPNGAQGIARIRIEVADLAASTARYTALVGADSVRLDGSRTHVEIGATVIELVGPETDAVRSRLQSRGEGVASVLLRGSTATELDQGLSHGAALSIGVIPAASARG